MLLVLGISEIDDHLVSRRPLTLTGHWETPMPHPVIEFEHPLIESNPGNKPVD